MIYKKSYIKKLIKEEIILLEKQLEEISGKTAGAILGIFTTLMSAKDSKAQETTTPRDSVRAVVPGDINFMPLGNNIFVSKEAQNATSMNQIRTVIPVFENSKTEMLEYFLNPDNLSKLIDLSAYDRKDLNIKNLSSAIEASVKRKLSDLKFKIVSESEIEQSVGMGVQGVFYSQLNEIQVIIELTFEHEDDIARIIKHELHHAIADYINRFLSIYKDDKSYSKFDPHYHDSDNDFDHSHDSYLRHPWENSAYSYSLRKVFNLSPVSGVNDLLRGFANYDIHFLKKGNLYAYKIPDEEGTPGDKGTASSMLVRHMMKKTQKYQGDVGKSALSQIGSAISPFAARLERDQDNNIYLLLDLEALSTTLNKTADASKTISGKITTENRRTNESRSGKRIL